MSINKIQLLPPEAQALVMAYAGTPDLPKKLHIAGAKGITAITKRYLLESYATNTRLQSLGISQFFANLPGRITPVACSLEEYMQPPFQCIQFRSDREMLWFPNSHNELTPIHMVVTALNNILDHVRDLCEKPLSSYCLDERILLTRQQLLNGRVSFSRHSSLHRFFGKDFDLMMTLVKRNGLNLKYASRSLRNHQDLVRAAIKQNPEALRYASINQQRAAVQHNGLDLEYVHDTQKYNPVTVRLAVQQNGLALEYAHDTQKNDPFTVSIAVKQNGLALKHASDFLKSDPGIVYEAVRQDGLALKYAHFTLQDDPVIVWNAITQNGFALRFASKVLQKASRIVEAAVLQEGLALQFADPALQNNLRIARFAVQNNGRAWDYVDVSLKTHPEILYPTVQSFPDIVLHRTLVHQACCQNPQLFLVAIEADEDGVLLERLPETLTDDYSFMLAATQSKYSAYFYASPRLQQEEEIALALLSQIGQYLEYLTDQQKNSPLIYIALEKSPRAYKYIGESLKHRPDVLRIMEAHKNTPPSTDFLSNEQELLALVTANGMNLERANLRLRQNRNVVEAAVRNNGLALQFASRYFAYDIDICIKAVLQNQEASAFVSDEVKASVTYQLATTKPLSVTRLFPTETPARTPAAEFSPEDPFQERFNGVTPSLQPTPNTFTQSPGHNLSPERLNTASPFNMTASPNAPNPPFQTELK